MDIEYPAFGRIVIDGETYDHDVVIDEKGIRARDKGPSKSLKSRYGHTPLTIEEDIPWSTKRLVVGSGYSGRLPVTEEIAKTARRRGVDLVVMPTAEAAALLNDSDPSQFNAVLHVTC